MIKEFSNTYKDFLLMIKSKPNEFFFFSVLFVWVKVVAEAGTGYSGVEFDQFERIVLRRETGHGSAQCFTAKGGA